MKRRKKTYLWPKTHRVLGLVSEPSSPLHADRCGHRRSSLFVATVALLWWWSETKRVRPKSTSHVTDGRAYSWHGSFIGPSKTSCADFRRFRRRSAPPKIAANIEFCPVCGFFSANICTDFLIIPRCSEDIRDYR
jgi:hypothetical protein